MSDCFGNLWWSTELSCCSATDACRHCFRAMLLLLTGIDFRQYMGPTPLGGTLFHNDISRGWRTRYCIAAFDFALAFFGCYQFCRPLTGRTPAASFPAPKCRSTSHPATTHPVASRFGTPFLGGIQEIFCCWFFITSLTVLQDGLFADTIMLNSRMKDETRLLPSSLATCYLYVFIRDITARPICIAKTPMPPEANCRAGPWNVDCWCCCRIWKF